MDFDELVDAYRELAVAHAKTQAELEKLRHDMRECWAELERLRSLDPSTDGAAVAGYDAPEMRRYPGRHD